MKGREHNSTSMLGLWWNGGGGEAALTVSQEATTALPAEPYRTNWTEKRRHGWWGVLIFRESSGLVSESEAAADWEMDLDQRMLVSQSSGNEGVHWLLVGDRVDSVRWTLGIQPLMSCLLFSRGGFSVLQKGQASWDHTELRALAFPLGMAVRAQSMNHGNDSFYPSLPWKGMFWKGEHFLRCNLDITTCEPICIHLLDLTGKKMTT